MVLINVSYFYKNKNCYVRNVNYYYLYRKHINIIEFSQISNSFQTRLLYRNSRILKGDLKTGQVNLQKRST